MSFFDIHPTIPELIAYFGPRPWWYACQNPERPHDGDVVYAGECVTCTLAKTAAALSRPDASIIDVDPDSGYTVTTLRESKVGR